MKLQSARDLKNHLVVSQVEPLSTMPKKATELAIAARDVRRVEPTPRTVALGVSRATDTDYRLAVRVQNQALMHGPEVARIRKAARGELDLRYVGRLVKRALWHRSRQRPLLIGVSIGHYKITAGTLGCFVTVKSGALRILSNNHVLANENEATKGDAVIQQGAFDGGTRTANTVGALDRFVRLREGRVNLVDAAIASTADGIVCDLVTLRGLGMLSGVGRDPLDIGDEVAKIGRTTGLTRGRVTAFELDNVVVAYDHGNLRFDNQIEIEGSGDRPFSQGGDSGSIIVDHSGRAVALLFAGGDQGGSNGRGLTYANPIGAVFDALRIEIAL